MINELPPPPLRPISSDMHNRCLKLRLVGIIGYIVAIILLAVIVVVYATVFTSAVVYIYHKCKLLHRVLRAVV